MSLFTITFSLFLIIDPIGNIPFFVSYLKSYEPKKQRMIILRELFIALFIMILFEFIGDHILSWLRIDITTIQVSGGIILFLISLGMIFPSIKTGSNAAKDHDTEPFIVPLAIPLIAGPTVLAAIMVYTKQSPGYTTMLFAIIIAWIFSTIVLLGAPYFKKVLKEKGLIAAERLMGLLLTFISVQMFMEGLMSFFK